jgi:hypothetical protein
MPACIQTSLREHPRRLRRGYRPESWPAPTYGTSVAVCVCVCVCPRVCVYVRSLSVHTCVHTCVGVDARAVVCNGRTQRPARARHVRELGPQRRQMAPGPEAIVDGWFRVEGLGFRVWFFVIFVCHSFSWSSGWSSISSLVQPEPRTPNPEPRTPNPEPGQEPDMLYHRAYAASVASGDCFFVAGGNFGISYLDTVEMFDARKGTWRSRPLPRASAPHARGTPHAHPSPSQPAPLLPSR